MHTRKIEEQVFDDRSIHTVASGESASIAAGKRSGKSETIRFSTIHPPRNSCNAIIAAISFAVVFASGHLSSISKKSAQSKAEGIFSRVHFPVPLIAPFAIVP